MQNVKFKMQNYNLKSRYQSLNHLFYRWLLVVGFLSAICHLPSAICYAQGLSSKQLVIKAREAQAKKDYDAVFKYTAECINSFKDQAKKQHAELSSQAQQSGKEEKYQILNDVATSYFIQGEVYFEQEKFEEAKKTFNIIIAEYPYSHAWDPRGWFYSLAEKSRDSVKKINQHGKKPEDKDTPEPFVLKPATKLTLHDFGKEEIVDYEKYGRFIKRGTKDYKYVIDDQEGLSAATGEGIYPNTTSVRWNPRFSIVKKEGRLADSHWDLVHSPDIEAAFFRWAFAPEPVPVKLFYTALILEKAGYIKHAIKAYYAILVHFPDAYGWTYWHTPWYVGQAALYKIKYLTEKYPRLGIKLEDVKMRVVNGFDADIKNDIVIADPGKLRKVVPWIENLSKIKERFLKRRELKKIDTIIGEGDIKLVKFVNNQWQLRVNNKPYIIKGITYSPVKTGQSPDNQTLTSWMEYDFNGNGKIDGPYDAFVDKNSNNQQDKNEPATGDFALMNEMGVNTIRVYHQPFGINKELLRDLYANYGIRVIMGDFLGKYALGSGAIWYEGTDYANPEHKKNMLESVKNMVKEFKDEPYILIWLLGNENVYGVACNADKDPESFFKFVNEVAIEIKKIDKNHPVAIASGDTLYLDLFAKFCPDVDIFAANSYRGNYGFVDFWQAVYDETKKPAFITEYGCAAYLTGRPLEDGEEAQADYHRGAWGDIMNNSAGFTGYGNSLGGVVFEWLDEWWKAYEPSLHDARRLWAGPFPDGFMYEEWLGIAGQGDGKMSPYLRHLRKGYYLYKEMWRKK
ncbi:MAG: hypothetical protein COV72_03730 [Candidatus Omnitrophica bacterium CG11_big_fil_rev_8_21_14_0_20_42_13]|uniref:Glycoside hydrolase family 2 catalytic domain-containing protein n=1 Tax=Candidatus Ghiorseimicrobium undicola TaxID=1974746 RepID=A0A2H0LY70_9BACT|nr:MAG: hypothetical protein COV72_03730 [Candidatus Omnitrophica bacterium CG11_big_fil_rev_8_21_14_0_20_42_13]